MGTEGKLRAQRVQRVVQWVQWAQCASCSQISMLSGMAAHMGRTRVVWCMQGEGPGMACRAAHLIVAIPGRFCVLKPEGR